MTGVATSADGGVCGGRFRGSIFWLRERRRIRSDDAAFDVGVTTLGTSASSGAAFGTGSTVLSAATVLGLLSSLELFSVLFFERKTSRSLLTDDCLDNDWGGVRPVWLCRRDGVAESRLFSLPLNVDDLDCVGINPSEGSDPMCTDACMAGDDVVRCPI
jgi:hypothetical protein